MTKLTGNQMAVVIAAEQAREYLTTHLMKTPSNGIEATTAITLTDEQLAAMALEDQRREVVQLRFGNNKE